MQEQIAQLIRDEEERRLVISNYAKYVEYVHEGRWLPAKHLLFVCDNIQRFLENDTGNPYDILILQMPPQHGKSMSTTETLPSWYLGKNPTERVIEISYNEDFAQLFGRRNKSKMEQFGSKIFGINLAKKPNSDTEFELSNNVGGMISRGVLSGVTGRPCRLMIIDDPVKNREEADSETRRNKVWDEWQNSFKTRLAAGAKVIVIMTRWHEDDIAGRMIMYEKNVQVINLPCEAEEADPIGREQGEALFPEIGKDKGWLQLFKDSYMRDPTSGGVRAWNALFQGRPTTMEGNMFKQHYWRYWKPKGMEMPPVTIKLGDEWINIYAEDMPDYWDEQLQSWDCTFKDNNNSDFVCGGVWGRRVANYYLLDLINQRMDIVATMSAIEAFSEKYPKALRKLIEDKANGSAVISILKRKLSGMTEVQPEGGKVARANAVIPAIESGNVYLPHPLLYNWVNQYITQHSQFPNGSNDDMVDMTTQALNHLIYKKFDTMPEKERRYNFDHERPQVDGYLGGEVDNSYISGGW